MAERRVQGLSSSPWSTASGAFCGRRFRVINNVTRSVGNPLLILADPILADPASTTCSGEATVSSSPSSAAPSERTLASPLPPPLAPSSARFFCLYSGCEKGEGEGYLSMHAARRHCRQQRQEEVFHHLLASPQPPPPPPPPPRFACTQARAP